MKLIDIKPLMEGGHAIDNAVPMSRDMYQHVYDSIEKMLTFNGKPLNFHVIGSAGKKDMSSDVDVMVDSADLINAMGTKDLKTARMELEQHIAQMDLPTARTGVSVHTGVPVGDGYVQVDIMGVDNAESARHFHQHEYDSDAMKGSTIHKMWAALARASSTDDLQLMMSPYKGLVNRESKELITSDKDEVAKYLIGPDATREDLGSVNRILSKLQDYPQKLQAVKDALGDEI